MRFSDLKLFIWNDTETNHKKIPSDESIFIFRISDHKNDKLEILVFEFKLSLHNHGGNLLKKVISALKILIPKLRVLLAQQITDFIKSCFRFRRVSSPNRNAGNSSKLVFVADVAVNGDDLVNDDDDASRSPVFIYQADEVHYNTRSINRTIDVEINFDFDVEEQQQRERRNIETQIGSILTQAQRSFTVLSSILPFLNDDFGVNEENIDNAIVNEENSIECCDEEEVKNVLTILRSHYKIKDRVLRTSKRLANKRNRDEIDCENKVPNTSQSLSKIKQTIRFATEEELREDCTCSICLENMSNDGDNLKIIRCKHVFHRKCLLKWLSKKQSCPCCRSYSFVDVFVKY
ncbi:uncharacterized protein LOC130803465 [Amaranthus tricolor]|uniref:uncharacterized protein LOC130803465 n=1 Tax=Amaranthus tricolor TaxID=29722 RepID=UPI0025865123|nr:uncharacterized protein LOC130803465 [Amaranthus tricolor]